MEKETINSPAHYNAHPGGMGCIELVERLPFNDGNAVKYLWRADEKGAPLEDLKKARWYVLRARDSEHSLKRDELLPDDLVDRACAGFSPAVAGAIVAIVDERYNVALQILDTIVRERSEAAQ